MSNTHTRPASQKRRRSQANVELPQDKNAREHRDSDAENSPLKPSVTNTDMAHKKLLTKRKLHDDDDSHTREDSLPKAKKAKVTSDVPDKPIKKKKQKGDGEPEPKKTKVAKEQHATAEEFPNGAIYCHQCGKKRDKALSIQCTLKYESGTGRIARCAAKYCKPCLHNRYKVDLDELRAQLTRSSSPSKKQNKIHVTDEVYIFECFRCCGVCNCPNCQKSRGDEPLGNLAVKARRAERAAVAEEHDASKTEKPTTARKGKGINAPPKDSAGGEASTSADKAKTQHVKPKTKAPKPKAVPKPTWTRVPTSLPLAEAETRIGIREFVQRFSGVLQVATGHLEELDELSVESLGDTSSWDDEGSSVEIYTWVSELCVKAIILGLADVFAADAEADGDHVAATAAKDAARTIRASGANLNRIWAALATLQEQVPALDFRGPLPPPSTTVIRHTRSGMQSGTEAVHIASSAQLVPVVADLIELLIPTTPIREAFEAGAALEKEITKEAKEAITQENAAWKSRTETKDKASRESHHQMLQDLEYSGRLATALCEPRFAPLGRDNKGRLYYAMSPGSGEYEAASQLIRGKDGKVRVGKRKGMWTEDDRRGLQKWSWFVAVWGRKPADARVAASTKRGDDIGSDAKNGDEGMWWCFWQPGEITKLADWIAVSARLPEEQPKEKSKRAGSADAVHSAAAATNGVKAEARSSQSKTSRSRKSSATSSLTSLSSLQSSREFSPLSDLSDDETEDEQDADTGDESIRIGPVNERELRGLVRGLREYADMLTWRVKRVTRDVEEKDRKSPGAKANGVSTK